MTSAAVGAVTGAEDEIAPVMTLCWIRVGTLGLCILRRMSTASIQSNGSERFGLKTGARRRDIVRQRNAENAS